MRIRNSKRVFALFLVIAMVVMLATPIGELVGFQGFSMVAFAEPTVPDRSPTLEDKKESSQTAKEESDEGAAESSKEESKESEKASDKASTGSGEQHVAGVGAVKELKPRKPVDRTPPELNAAVANGFLVIEASDGQEEYATGVHAIVVNGYKFEDLEDGKLTIRLQQFDTGYEFFTVYAVDAAGNQSATFKVDNPYYLDSEAESTGVGQNVAVLPLDGNPSNPSNAKGTVVDYASTSTDGTKDREFYTIKTANDKVFYLIVDKSGTADNVYFLTEINENDLLSTVTTNTQTLPMNSAATEAGIHLHNTTAGGNAAMTENPEKNASGETLADEDKDKKNPDEEIADESKSAKDAENNKNSSEGKAEKKKALIKLLLGLAAVALLGIIYYMKFKLKKKEDFGDSDDSDEDAFSYDRNQDQDSDPADNWYMDDDE